MRFVVGQGQARGLRAGLFKVLLGVFALVIAVRVTMAENWAVGLPLGAWGLVETVTRAVVVASVGGHSYLLQFFFLRPALFGAIFSGALVANMAVHRNKAMLAFGTIFLIPALILLAVGTRLWLDFRKELQTH